MKKTKVIIPALAVLLLSTAASVSGTVAWFSMNNTVTVQGMTVRTKVSSNLLIAETNLEANYSDAITQVRDGVLEPASTVNGKNFFFTTNAKGNGDAKTDSYKTYAESTAFENANAGKANYDATFNSDYGFTGAVAANNVCYGYIDYSFYIKATSAKANQVLYMSKCNLTYKADGSAYSAIANGFAWRVALLSGDAVANQEFNDANLSLKSILGLDKSLNQNQVNEVNTSGFDAETSVTSYFTDPQGKIAATGTYQAGTKYYSAPGNTPNAVDSASTLGAVTSPNAAAQAKTGINAGVTSYQRIVVRLYLEGEDISCTSTTYATLTQDWKLTLEFKLGDADDGAEQNPVANGVKVISSDPDLDA